MPDERGAAAIEPELLPRLELGCGTTPTEGYVHHDRVAHSDFVDVAWDLDKLPWPWPTESFSAIQAIDVMEHLSLDPWWQWLDECWRIMEVGGVLTLRLPAWDNPMTYRDPTHRGLPFHEERFMYWDPCRELWDRFGRIYPFATARRWWHVVGVVRDAGDFRYFLRKLEDSDDHDDPVADGG